ncbi:tripartite tricarboxylate transporter TctB family protein [Marispirochaeta aestuarii]|uniref:tripartite tricarboxylate transporter TctB family protein n=1 Tax=Marispirochaeta aestuarii TaxID=1963862 RepID=UPI0029C95244|nr:tripartite tricarboxylate transporter TctB family protein [Marispirochaeta aestuarii]
MFKKAEIVFGGAAILFALLFFILAGDFPGARGHDVGMAFYPRVLSVLIIVLSFIVIFQGITRKETETESTGTLFYTEDNGVRRVVLLILATLIYPYLLQYAGFLILTPVYLGFLMWVIGAGKLPRILLLSVLTTVLIYVIFQRMLKIPLPTGLFYN